MPEKIHLTRSDIKQYDMNPTGIVTPMYIGQYCITDDNKYCITDDNKVFFANGLTSNDWIEASGNNDTLDEILNEINSKTGDLNSLQTQDKSNLVGAINELFQNVDSGKQLIADAIDNDNVTKDSTFEAMSDVIVGIKSQVESNRESLGNFLIDNGYSITGDETFEELLAKISFVDIKQIVTGYNFSVLLKNNKELWVSGYIQDSSTSLLQNRKFILYLKDVVQVAKGDYHIMYLKSDGNLYGYGINKNGQMGTGSTANAVYGQQVNTNVKQVACGSTHTAILKNNGEVLTVGDNSYGQLGIGNTYSQYSYQDTGLTDVKQIACGVDYTVAVKNDGTVWATGSYCGSSLTSANSFTQANITDVDKIYAGTGSFSIIAKKHDGTFWGLGVNNNGMFGVNGVLYEPTLLTHMTDIKDISCGLAHTLVIKNDGSLWSCGYNYYGQCGQGTGTETYPNLTKVTSITDKVNKVSCGRYSSFVVTEKNDIYACGDNYYGQLGLNDSTSAFNSLQKLDRGF